MTIAKYLTKNNQKMLALKKSVYGRRLPGSTRTQFLKSFLLLLCAFLFEAVATQAQEIRLNTQVLYLSDINGGFSGIGMGVEAPFSRHFAVSMDANMSFIKPRSLLIFRPGLRFYTGKDQIGLFFGPSIAYLKLKTKGTEQTFSQDLYGMGFSLGVKGKLSGRSRMLVSMVPQLLIGPFNGTIASGFVQLGWSYRI
jgi:hypothetical protein